VTPNYEFIAAAYIATAAVLGGYAWWMKRRIRTLARQVKAWQAPPPEAPASRESVHEPQP